MDLPAVLRDSLSPVHATRTHAEQALAGAALPPLDPDGALGIALAHHFLRADAPLAERQAAGTALKRYIRERWSVAFEDFLASARATGVSIGGAALPLSAKAAIRVALLDALPSPERKVRLLGAQLLALVSASEFPDNFPELLPAVRELLVRGAPDGVHGALVFFADLVSEDLDEGQLLLVARDYIPLLYDVLVDTRHAPLVRARCVLVFRQCLVALFTVRETYADTVRAAADAHIPRWLDAMCAVLTHTPPAPSCAALGLAREIVRAFGAAQHFRAVFARHSDAVLRAVLAALERLAPVFAATELDGSATTAAPPDGDSDVAADPPALGIALLAFFGDAARAPFMRAFLVHGGVGGAGTATPALHTLVRSAQFLAQITLDDAAAWADDADAFVAEDDEENMALTLRTAAMDLADALINEFPGPALAAFGAALAQTAPASAPRAAEALLLLVGAMHTSIEEVVGDVGGIDPAQILALCAAATTSTDSFLQGRALVCASQFSASADGAAAATFLRGALAVTRADYVAAPLHTKLAAVRALRNFGNILPHVTAAYTAEIVVQLGPLLARARGPTLVLIADTLEAAIHNAAEAQRLEPPLYAELALAALGAWRTSVPEPQAELALAGLLEAMACSSVPHVPAQTVRIALGPALEVLAEPDLALSAAALIRTLVDAAPPTALAPDVLFPAAVEYVLGADDAEAVQHILHCLTVLVQKDAPGVLAHGGVHALLRVVERVLAPGADAAMCAMPLGTLLVTLFVQAGAHLSPIMPALVHVLATRVAASDVPACTAALLYPLAFLFAEHTDAVLHVLADAPDTLARVAARWAAELAHVHGTFVLNVHILGATHLLDRWPAALDTPVDGDPLPAPAGMIITRSRAANAQFSRIPAGAKMLKELLEVVAPAAPATDAATDTAALAAAAADADYADEWCDEPDLGDLDDLDLDDLDADDLDAVPGRPEIAHLDRRACLGAFLRTHADMPAAAAAASTLTDTQRRTLTALLSGAGAQ